VTIDGRPREIVVQLTKQAFAVRLRPRDWPADLANR
jgi:hypothetical protein